MDEMFLSLVDALVPVYKNHLSIQDLKDGIEMYKTPIGKNCSKNAFNYSRNYECINAMGNGIFFENTRTNAEINLNLID